MSAYPAITTITGDTLRWNFTNLKPSDTAGIFIEGRVAAPPVVNPGDTLRSTVTIYPLSTDLTKEDNICSFLQNVFSSYDPNDKSERHTGTLRTLQVQQGENLQYTIRFQNTGTDLLSMYL